MIIGAPFSPRKLQAPTSFNITSPFPYCKRQKRALHHPRRGSQGSRYLIGKRIYAVFPQPAAARAAAGGG